jgi:ferredoxin
MMTETVTRKLMFFFPKCECEKPIIYHLVKDYDLVVNVFRAKVTPEEEGYLVLDVTGIEADIDRGIEFVKTFNVTVNSTGKGVTWDKECCVHCGQCIPHCPTGALHIADKATREVTYDEADCIECLACIRVCPFGACSSAF